ncbi:MAG: hypothetical protein ACLR23_16150 [Clostridia bacterium]
MEPAHQLIQLIDPIAQLRQWVNKVVHLHGKDASVDWDAVRRLGVYGAHDFAPERTPGFGDTNWRDIFSILYGAGYEGDICVEEYRRSGLLRGKRDDGSAPCTSIFKMVPGRGFRAESVGFEVVKFSKNKRT